MQETNRVVALEPVSRAVTPVGKSRWTADLIWRILAVLVTVTDKLHVDAVVAVAAELTRQTLTVLCGKIQKYLSLIITTTTFSFCLTGLLLELLHVICQAQYGIIVTTAAM